MRGKKGQSIEEVEDLLWEYEDDITTRTQKLNELIVRPFSYITLLTSSHLHRGVLNKRGHNAAFMLGFPYKLSNFRV